MVMVHYREVSPPANNVATSHYGHHQQWDLPQHFGDTKPGQSAFRIASVVTMGIDESSYQPGCSRHCSVFRELNSSQNLQDEKQGQMFNEILMGSLIAIKVRLFVAVHCWILDSIFLSRPSNLQHLIHVEDGSASNHQENIAGLWLETDGDHDEECRPGWTVVTILPM